jgi:acyl carrier protein
LNALQFIQWRSPLEVNMPSPTLVAKNEHRSAAQIQAWIASYLAALLEVEPDEVDVSLPFDRYGLDSAVAIGLTGDLEDWLGTQLDPTLLYDYPTVAALSKHLAAELAAK